MVVAAAAVVEAETAALQKVTVSPRTLKNGWISESCLSCTQTASGSILPRKTSLGLPRMKTVMLPAGFAPAAEVEGALPCSSSPRNSRRGLKFYCTFHYTVSHWMISVARSEIDRVQEDER